MAATVLLKWIRLYKRNKMRRDGAVSAHMNDIASHISHSIYQSMRELHSNPPDDEEQKREVSRVLDFERSILDENNPSQKSIGFKVDSRISEEYKHFIHDNPEYFESLKTEKEKSGNTRNKLRNKKKSKFRTITGKNLNSNSLEIAPVGQLFYQDDKPSLVKKTKNKKMLKKKILKAKIEKQMKSTQAFMNINKLQKQETAQFNLGSENEDYYSYQHIDPNELSFSD